jgi:2-oxoglutarate ferredoxin oxidoreductase subunit alpha
MLGESNYTIPKYDLSKVIIDRGKLAINNGSEQMRYADTEDGISPRWFPGDDISTFLANSDEHTPKGASTESAVEVQNMISKRARKFTTIKAALPDPLIYGDPLTAKIKIVSWGSNKPTILAAMQALEETGVPCSLLQIQYLWPLKTEVLTKYLEGNVPTAIFEVNSGGQLASLLKSETGFAIPNKFLKYDGRPFYYEEVLADLRSLL